MPILAFLANFYSLHVSIIVFLCLKLLENYLKLSETERNFEKKDKFFEGKKMLNSKHEAYKSLLCIIILVQAYIFLSKTELNTNMLTVVYKFQGFVCISSS